MNEFKPQTLQQIRLSIVDDVNKLTAQHRLASQKEKESLFALIQAKKKQEIYLQYAINAINDSGIETESAQVALVLRSTISKTETV